MTEPRAWKPLPPDESFEVEPPGPGMHGFEFWFLLLITACAVTACFL